VVAGGKVELRAARKYLNGGFVIPLEDVVGAPVLADTKLEIMSAFPATLKPGQVLIKLNGFVRIAHRVVLVERRIENIRSPVESLRQGISVHVGRAEAICLEDV
jgi:hypothetical protein